MFIDRIKIGQNESNDLEVSARIRSRLLKRPFRLYYSFDSKFRDYVTGWGDPFLLAVLPICSYYGEEINIDAPISPQLLERIPAAIDKFREFFKSFCHVPIKSKGQAFPREAIRKDRLSAAFFSHGLDSLYTLTENREEIDILIIRASDMWDWEPAYVSDVVSATRATLKKLHSHADILVVRTNAAQLSDGLVHHAKHYSGASQAAIAYLFSSGIRRTFVPAGYSLDFLQRTSEHPDFDRLWCSERMEMIHDSPIRRLDKIIKLSQQPDLVEHLRVCRYKLPRKFNCGWCVKCIGTSISLYVCGILDHCKTLPQKIRVERIPYLDPAATSQNFLDRDRWIKALGDKPEDLELKSAILEWSARVNRSDAHSFESDTHKARELAMRGRFSEAREAIRRLLEIDPYDPRLNFGMGFCVFFSERNLRAAEYFFNKAEEYGCDEFWLTCSEALLKFSGYEFGQGMAKLRHARRMRPDVFRIGMIKEAIRRALMRFSSDLFERVKRLGHS